MSQEYRQKGNNYRQFSMKINGCSLFANKFGQTQQQFELSQARKSAADAARAKATGDLIGGVTGAIGMASGLGAFGTGSVGKAIGGIFGGS